MANPAPHDSAPRDQPETSLLPPTPTTSFDVSLPRRNSSIDTAKAWDQPQFPPGEPQENSNGHLTPAQRNARSRAASEGGGSRTGQTPSTIHDQGDGELLSLELLDRKLSKEDNDNNTSSSPPPSPINHRSPSESQTHTSDIALAQIGGTFRDKNGIPQPEPPSLNLDEPLTSQPIPLPSGVEEPKKTPLSFEKEIRAAFKVSASKAGGKYLPISDFNRIVTRDRVRQELAGLVPHTIHADKLDWYTDQVWDPAPPTSSRQHESRRPTTRRKIFAILALIQKVEDIVNFIEAKLHDSDLPFLLADGPNPELQRKGRDGTLYPITIVSDWPTFLLEVFNDYQWKLLPPYFTLSTKTKPEVLHYSFEDGTVLPLIEDEEIASGNSGGYGDVWRVKIHPAHHNCSHEGPSEQVNPDYAIKRLRHSNREAFKDEVSNLKRFSSRDHLHLIKLLVTFEWRKEFYLLFPCADGNLLDFWKRYRTVEQLPRDHKFAVWFSGQCLGLAEGLKMIHTVEVKRGEFLGIPAQEQEKTHGRHGDLKPENILWFGPVGAYRPHKTDEGSDMGVLKISDFGLSKFHRTGSLLSGQKINGKSTAVSPTYRAPEYDIDQGFDQSYDIWTLGCVLLEFVAWYVLGWDEVERFSQRRAADDYREIKEDVFFNNVEIFPEDGDRRNAEMGAQAKRAVYDEFQVLYQHPRCSDFILDLLYFIENDLLRMTPSRRAKCETIVDKLAGFHELCKADGNYCTKRKKSDCPRARTDLSVLAASALPYSDVMKKRIRRGAVPEVRQPTNFPSLASQIVEGFSNFIDSHRSDESNGIRESSRGTAQVVPRLTITEPTQSSQPIAITDAPDRIDDAQSGLFNDSARQTNHDSGAVTPPGGTHPQQQTLQPAQANTDADSTDQDSQRKTGDQPASPENDRDGSRVVGSTVVPRGSPPQPERGRTPERGSLGQLLCRCLPRRRRIHSETGSQHEVETFPAGKEDERK